MMQAQTDVDALRYSQTSVAGTARFTSMAGAFGAVGGDFSSLSLNPAGISVYRKSEFTMTPSLYLGQTNSNFLGKSTTENRFNFNFGNIGLVFTYPINHKQGEGGWQNWNFGLGFNRLNNFQANTYYEGVNNNNSQLDYFVQQANKYGISSDGFYEYLANQTGLIYTVDSLGNFTNDMMKNNIYRETQRRTGTTRGAITETVFSFGGNYNNKLYLGATLGIRSLRYTDESMYEEIDKSNNIPEFANYSFNQYVSTSGVGVNLKLGMIYRANDYVRLGVAFHTPSFYSLHDDYKNTMRSQFDSLGNFSQSSPEGAYDYNLTTPFRAVGSIAFVFGKMGLISADYEYADYSGTRFDASGSSFADVNDLIRQNYTSTGNLKIGTEWNYQNFVFRGGYAMNGSPFSTRVNLHGADGSRTSYTGGIGIRDKDFYFDIGYVYTTGKDYYQPYTLSDTEVPGIINTATNHNFTFTFGVKF
jgi:hypothetical protein